MSDEKQTNEFLTETAQKLMEAATQAIYDVCKELELSDMSRGEYLFIIDNAHIGIFASGIGALTIAADVLDGELHEFLNERYAVITAAVMHARLKWKQKTNN